MSKPVIRIYGPGSEVLINEGTITARVLTVQISSYGVRYECVWWTERDRQSDTFEEWELKPDNDKTRAARVDPIL